MQKNKKTAKAAADKRIFKMCKEEAAYTLVNVINHYQQLSDEQKVAYNTHFFESFRPMMAAKSNKAKAVSQHQALEVYGQMSYRERLNVLVMVHFRAIDKMPEVKKQFLESKEMLFLNPEHAETFATSKKSLRIQSRRSPVRLKPALDELAKIELMVHDCVAGMDVLTDAFRREEQGDLEYLVNSCRPHLIAINRPKLQNAA